MHTTLRSFTLEHFIIYLISVFMVFFIPLLVFAVIHLKIELDYRFIFVPVFYFMCFSYCVKLSKEKIVLEHDRVTFVKFVWKPEKPGCFFKYRISTNGMKQYIETESFLLADLAAYGLVEDLKQPQYEFGPMPHVVLEAAFLLHSGEACHLNIKRYSKKKIRLLREHLRNFSGVEPTGSLANL